MTITDYINMARSWLRVGQQDNSSQKSQRAWCKH